MAKPIVDDLISLEEGMVMYDAFLKEDVLVVAPVMCLLADNPRLLTTWEVQLKSTVESVRYVMYK